MPTTWTADAHVRAGGRTWLYDFAWRGPAGATHGIDVPFVFGLPVTRAGLVRAGARHHPDLGHRSRHRPSAARVPAPRGRRGCPGTHPGSGYSRMMS
ncbi:hypothetical protein ACFQQB_11650 [Nonomuraea rubra]|uniref:hypothetical protein n=1 Tax=Nonomuraea rubra TaxID=46180 RepID=UPI00360C09A2